MAAFGTQAADEEPTQPSRVCLLLMIGLPAAGKSRLCRQLMSEAELGAGGANEPLSVSVICYDDIIEADQNLENEFNPEVGGDMITTHSSDLSSRPQLER